MLNVYPIMRRLLSGWRLSVGGMLTLSFAVLVGQAFAQQIESNESGTTLFVPSADVDSPTFFSSVDAARKNRPPKPAKTHEDLFYPDGFLTISAPTPQRIKQVAPIGGEEHGVASNPEKVTKPLRPLDPSVETTPLLAPTVVDRAATKKGDNILFFVISISLAGLGFFLLYDYRYRDRLKEDLVENAKLCSPKAVSADFDAVLARGPEMTNPYDPSFVNPTFDPLALSLEDSSLRRSLNNENERFEIAEIKSVGADLEEENFDFTPKGGTDLDLTEDEVGDFVVGEGTRL